MCPALCFSRSFSPFYCPLCDAQQNVSLFRAIQRQRHFIHPALIVRASASVANISLVTRKCHFTARSPLASLVYLAASPLCAPCHIMKSFEDVLCQCVKYDDERKGIKDSLCIPPSSAITLPFLLGPWSSQRERKRATKALLKNVQKTDLLNNCT